MKLLPVMATSFIGSALMLFAVALFTHAIVSAALACAAALISIACSMAEKSWQ